MVKNAIKIKEDIIMDWNSLNQSMTSTLMKIMNCANKKLRKMTMRFSLFKYKLLILQKRIIQR